VLSCVRRPCTAGALVIAAGAALLALDGCSRVPEQALRDEQGRSRRYRDAYESLQDETTALRARLAELEKQGRCSAAPATR
jgi:hypothetical protein